MSGHERASLAECLRGRLLTLELPVDSGGTTDRNTGLDVVYELRERAATTAFLEYWLQAIEDGGRWSVPAPLAVWLHAQSAASGGFSLAWLQRRYLRMRDLAWRATLEEVAGFLDTGDWPVLLMQCWYAGESLLDVVLSAVERAYGEALARQEETVEQRQAQLVRRLLTGDPGVDVRRIEYDFDAEHLALIATGGRGARRVVETLSERLGSPLFCLPEEQGTLTAWLKARGVVSREGIEGCLPAIPSGMLLAIGRIAAGVEGFCRSHHMAAEAFVVANHRPGPVTWYSDVDLDVLLLRDRVFAKELIASYLQALEPGVQEALRAYGAHGWNESAAARALEISRNSIHDRLQRAEAIIGRPLGTLHTGIELALRAQDLGLANQTLTT